MIENTHYFKIMAQDPEETDVFDSLRKHIVKHGKYKVQKAVRKYFCTYVGFILKTVIYYSLQTNLKVKVTLHSTYSIHAFLRVF